MNIIRNLYIALSLTALPSVCQAKDTLRINTDSMCIDIRYMMPLRYSPKAVTDFSLCIKGDTVISRLPYMGRAYQPTVGNTDNLNFSIPATRKSIKKGKKGKTVIKFSCKNNNISYDFKIEVYPEGSAYVYLVPSNADSIGYKGEWK